MITVWNRKVQVMTEDTADQAAGLVQERKEET
jgi:hypothetical protein